MLLNFSNGHQYSLFECICCNDIPPSLAPLTPLSSLHCPLTNKDTQKSTPQKTPSYNLPWKNVKEIFPLSRSCHPQSLQSACGMQLRDKHRHTHTHTHTQSSRISMKLSGNSVSRGDQARKHSPRGRDPRRERKSRASSEAPAWLFFHGATCAVLRQGTPKATALLPCRGVTCVSKHKAAEFNWVKWTELKRGWEEGEAVRGREVLRRLCATSRNWIWHSSERTQLVFSAPVFGYKKKTYQKNSGRLSLTTSLLESSRSQQKQAIVRG